MQTWRLEERAKLVTRMHIRIGKGGRLAPYLVAARARKEVLVREIHFLDAQGTRVVVVFVIAVHF
jgi:hypothetical protein